MHKSTNITRGSAVIGIVALCVGGVLLSGPARADRVLVDKVVAVVEDEAILQSDIDQAVKQFLLQQRSMGLSGSERSELEKEALSELINNKLVIAKANRLGISVSFSEIETAVERAIDENKKQLGGKEAFQQQLAAEGLTIESLKTLYREQIQNRMLVDRVLAREIDRASIEITEEELREAYATKKDELPERPDVVHLATIFVGLESSDNAKAKAKAAIDDLHRRIMAGEDFAQIAKEYSEDPSAETGGSLGQLKLSDLSNRAFADAAAVLSVGDVSEPVLTPFGYHLIQVTGADSMTGEVELRHILVRVTAEERDIEDVFEIANDVHRRLVEGAPFDSMAVRYSTDASSASKGGDLGWLKVADLPEFFRDVLEGLHGGEISPVLREPSGFRIVKLIEQETTRPYEFDEVRDELRQLLEQEKVSGKYNVYLETLRSEFYVEVRTQ